MCESLTSVKIPNSVTSIEGGVFSGCARLTNLTISKGVTSIGRYAFSGCTGLTSVIIPNSITSINAYAFAHCDSLQYVQIPSSVTSLGFYRVFFEAEAVFYDCPCLTSAGPIGGGYNIEFGWTEAIPEDAFIGSKHLISITIPKGVTSIGSNAFKECAGIISATIPQSVVSIGRGAFQDCDSLAHIYYGGSEKDWNKISIDFNNEAVTDATIHYNASVPVITEQPVDATVSVGKTAKFAVSLKGKNLTYQWQYRADKDAKWKNSGATSAKTKTLSVKGTEERNGYQYRCEIKDSKGNVVYSNAATLYVARFSITQQPSSVNVSAGATAKFSVSTSGDNLIFQWQYRTSETGKWKDSAATSATTNTFSVKGTNERDGYQYRCRISDDNGKTLYTNTATLRVTSMTITKQPSNVTAANGATAKFTVTAKGNGLTYQWQYRANKSAKWKDSGATSAKTNSFSIKGTTDRNGYQYRCKITDSNGVSVYTNTVTLSVANCTITKQPKDVTVSDGATAKFTVTATGDGLTYQWQYRTSATGKWKNSGATSATTNAFSVKGTAARNGYQYRCKITDSNGKSVYTKTVTLTVN